MNLDKVINGLREQEAPPATTMQEYDRRYGNLKELFLQTFFDRKKVHYKIDHFNKKQFDLMLWYFCQHPNFLNPENKTHHDVADYSFKKGIMMVGNVGCGKTEMITNFYEVLKRFQMGFLIHSCLDIEESFATSGYEALKEYTKPFTKVFDDLGFDDVVKFYGNEERIMIRVLEKRHRQFIDKGIISHFTTNLNGKLIKERYGERTHSRAKEMCNIINFDKDAKDRR